MTKTTVNRKNGPPMVCHWDRVPILIDTGLTAAILGLNVTKIREMCAAGELPAVRIRGEWRISKTKLMQQLGEVSV